MAAVPRSPRLPADLLLSFDVDCGVDLFPGHRVLARGLVDGGRSNDDLTSRDSSGEVECRLVSLSYELVPGVTRAEERARDGRPFTLDATYGADVPLPWSTGGTGPDGLAGPCAVEGYDERRWGGDSTVGELGPWPVPDGARRLTFWLRPVDGSRATGTVVVDLATGGASWAPLPVDDTVVALGAWCDLVPAHRATASPGSVSFDVHEFAQVADGRRVVLHAGERGFSVSGPGTDVGHPLGGLTAEGIRSHVLNTVLPDEDDGEQHPWEWLAGLLRGQGVAATAADLRGVPYTVELSDRVQRLLRTPSRGLVAPADATPGAAPVVVDEVAARVGALVARRDLAALRDELAALLDDVQEPRQAYASKQLLRALELFLDVHGDDGPIPSAPSTGGGTSGDGP